MSDYHAIDYAKQFANIRQSVKNDLINQGESYIAKVSDIVRTNMALSMEANTIAQQHCKYILESFRGSKSELLSSTMTNAMFRVDNIEFSVSFDFACPDKLIQSMRFLQPPTINDQLDANTLALLMRQVSECLATPINSQLIVRFEQMRNHRQTLLNDFKASQMSLRDTVMSRLCTAYDIEVGMAFYTAAFNEEMSMLFWDKYQIVEETAKSYHIEQYCIVEHVITGKVEQERLICAHKPSKNTLPVFLADRCACLTNLIRPMQTTVKSDNLIASINDEKTY